MDCYIDLRVLPDPEFSEQLLLNALFSKFHRRLVQLKSNDIAVSFPDVEPLRPGLGARVRVHGQRGSIGVLMHEDWLVGMHDHVRLSSLDTAPADVEHRQVHRVQVKSNAARIRRRLARRHSWTDEEALIRVPDLVAQTVRLPYLQLRSGSSGQRFNLFIEHREAKTPTEGTFNSYGLSDTATVPWF